MTLNLYSEAVNPNTYKRDRRAVGQAAADGVGARMVSLIGGERCHSVAKTPNRSAPAHLLDHENPAVAGLLGERMMGLEPTTFCMASRRSSQLSYIRE